MTQSNIAIHDEDARTQLPSLDQRLRLNRLIANCNVDARIYRDASAVVSDPEARTMLLALSRHRHAFSEELGHFVRLLGSRAHAGGSIVAALRRGLRQIRTIAMGGVHEGDIVRECGDAEERLSRRYQRALRAAWPAEIRAAILSQAEDVRAERDHMRGLRGAV